MTIRIDASGRQYVHTSIYVPVTLYAESKAMKIGISKVLEEALTNKVSEAKIYAASTR